MTSKIQFQATYLQKSWMSINLLRFAVTTKEANCETTLTVSKKTSGKALLGTTVIKSTLLISS